MALFGHDENVRRLSSPHSSQRGEDSLDSAGKEARCTAAKAKSCMKSFVANLFSHVGLCALVIAEPCSAQSACGLVCRFKS